MGQISPQIREKSSLGHFCHHFLNIKGNGKEGKVHFDLVYTDMAKSKRIRDAALSIFFYLFTFAA